MTAAPKIRCAIYTRKSSDEGLDQTFNSLDAQFEACAAYVASQKQEGWVLARDRFDDGGLSGGSLDRPALQHLLREIDAGRISMVVVYKIDRLTRSLADFARLVERFDAAGCSFVSVTQAFNTASSMGRLTLNVLLSFAQFEREVTAERIRDKIAASKKKGLWMGGVPPLGYDPHPDPNTRELVINKDEARTVETLFDLYDRHGSLAAVEREAEHLGLKSKHHRFRSGREQGGNRMSGGQIHKILLNPVYLGKTRHKDKIWPGKHAAIIHQDLWDRVQLKLQQAARRGRGRSIGASDPAPLTGKLYDDSGDRLTPTHSIKSGRRHRYYISHRLISGGPDPTGWRLPARALEKNVANLIAGHFDKAAREHRLLAAPDLRGDSGVQQAARNMVEQLRQQDPEPIRDLLALGTIGVHEINLTLDKAVVATRLRVPPADLAVNLCDIRSPLQLRRRGVEAKLVIGEAKLAPDATFLKALSTAHQWAQALKGGMQIKDIVAQTNCSGSLIRQRGKLAFLSPKIQIAICDGTLPQHLTLKQILRRPIPLDWTRQERIFGV